MAPPEVFPKLRKGVRVAFALLALLLIFLFVAAYTLKAAGLFLLVALIVVGGLVLLGGRRDRDR